MTVTASHSDTLTGAVHHSGGLHCGHSPALDAVLRDLWTPPRPLTEEVRTTPRADRQDHNPGSRYSSGTREWNHPAAPAAAGTSEARTPPLTARPGHVDAPVV
jgi:hypothetical protein